MKKMLYICAITTAACLSLSTAYSSDYLPGDPSNRNPSILYSDGFVYDRLNKANWHLQKYADLAKSSPCKDKELAKKISDHMDASTKLIFDNDVRIIGGATKETNDWYLTFVRMKAQNIQARFPNGLASVSVTNLLKYEFNIKDVDNETFLEKDPVLKLHFQLGILVSCCLLGVDNIERIFIGMRGERLYSDFKNTIDELERFTEQLRDIELTVKLTKVQEIYRDETQKDIKIIKKLKFLNTFPPLVYKPGIYEIKNEEVDERQLIIKRKLLYAKQELERSIDKARGDKTSIEIAQVNYIIECQKIRKEPGEYYEGARWGGKALGWI